MNPETLILLMRTALSWLYVQCVYKKKPVKIFQYKVNWIRDPSSAKIMLLLENCVTLFGKIPTLDKIYPSVF